MQTLDGIHILLVQDEPDNREVMKLVMEYQGGFVVAVPDAESALAVLATMKPDALITDLSMPKQDGAAFVEDARQRGLLDGVPTLAVTAFTFSKAQLRELGFDAYLRKPVDPNGLCTTVQALARRRPVPGQQ